MKSTFSIGDVSAAPGTKARGFVKVPNTAVQFPIVIANGAQEGPTLLVTAGIHGAEYPCIDAGIKFGAAVDAAQVCGQVIVCAPVSVNAFTARQAFYVPEDGKNLNRSFPGKPFGTIAEQMAYTLLTQVAERADVWLDLHGGDIPEALIPFSILVNAPDPKVTEKARAVAAAFGIEYVVMSSTIEGTTTGAAASRGIPAVLAEAGQLGILDDESTQILLNGCFNVARYMGVLPGEVTPAKVTEFANWPWVRATHTGCWYPQVKVGDTVQEGQVVGIVTDFFGEKLAEYRAPASGLVLLLCASMSIKQNDPLIGVAY
jgi:predicted deacylase